MRSWFFAVIAVLCFHSFSSAENLDSSDILNYEALMKLSLEDRTEYLQGVQELMIELENIEIDKRNREPQAASVFAGKPVVSKTSPMKVTCEQIQGLSMRLMPYRVYKAEPAKPPWYEPFAAIFIPYRAPENPKDFICMAPLLFENSCPEGLIPGAAQWRETVKVKVEKWDEKKKKDITVIEDYKKGKRFRCFTQASFNSLPLLVRQHLQRNVQEELSVEKDIAEREKLGLRSKGKVRVQPKNAKEKPIYISSTEKVASSCSSESIAAVREKFYRGPDSLCIYGGNISQYKDGVKKAGGCQPPSQFCFESPNCENSATGDHFKPAFKCGTNEVICNPLIFGIKEDGKTPFCIQKSSNATLACAEQSEDSQAGLKSLLLSDEKQDGSSWIQSTGFGNAWNQFADQFNNLCSLDKAGAAYFCRECAVMKNRIQSLNAATLDGKALKYNKAPKRVSGAK